MVACLFVGEVTQVTRGAQLLVFVLSPLCGLTFKMSIHSTTVFFSIGFHAVADIVLVSLLVHSRVCSVLLTVAYVKYSLQFFTDFIIFLKYCTCIDTVL